MSTPAKSAPKKSRRKAREIALQGLYQWKLTAYDAATIDKQLREHEDFARADDAHFATLLKGAIKHSGELEQALQPHLDRPIHELSPVESALLLLAAFELIHQPDIPYKVVINEAVELAKSYGGADGYKYVNGVLDKLAAQVRAIEIKAR